MKSKSWHFPWHALSLKMLRRTDLKSSLITTNSWSSPATVVYFFPKTNLEEDEKGVAKQGQRDLGLLVIS